MCRVPSNYEKTEAGKKIDELMKKRKELINKSNKQIEDSITLTEEKAKELGVYNKIEDSLLKDKELKLKDVVQNKTKTLGENSTILKKLTPKLDWKDISHEKYRTYTFIIEGRRVDVTIPSPVKLNVSKSGGHRILDARNVSHYIPFKWIHLFWETKNDQAFRF